MFDRPPNHKIIKEDLYRAVGRVNRPAALKLIDPGLLKFLIRKLERVRNRGVVHSAKLFYGGSMDIVLPEVVSEVIYTYGFFDEIVTWLALVSVAPGDVVLDVGAHFGYFSLLFS